MSTSPEARAWMRVRAEALRQNYASVRSAVGPATSIIPMVKADAYGLGMREVVRALEPEGPWGWGVAAVEEGARLRAMGVQAPVIVFCPLPEDSLGPALAARLQVTVSSLDALRSLIAVSKKVRAVPMVHVDVDTGMGRTGFDWRTARTWMPEVVAASRRDIEWVGCYTHLHSADENESSVREQWTRLQEVLALLGDSPERLFVHVLNSAGALRLPEFAQAAVRPGIFLYGGEAGAGLPVPEPVVSVHARVIHVRDAEPGTTLGYGATHQATRAERWATLSIGYGDGLPRALGNRGHALLGGVRVRVVGRISMDMTVVDITDVHGVRVGDVATLLGTAGRESITVDDVAGLAGTISYEILTGLAPRLPRVWTGLDES